MASAKEIKRRISSVTTTKQVMKAMDMVSASKLQRAKAKLDIARPMFTETNLIIDSLRNQPDTADSALFRPREVKNTAYVVIAGDKGLCGSYNSSVMGTALSHMNNGEKNEKLIIVGAKGWDYFRRFKKEICHRYIGISETRYYDQAGDIGEILLQWFKSGEIDEAFVVYTHFETTLSYVPRVIKLLPIEANTGTERVADSMGFEPDFNTFLEHTIPMYLNIIIYVAMVESVTCEHASRMTSMNAASNNASEIIDELTLMFNRKRQATITQEINEIVNGANMIS